MSLVDILCDLNAPTILVKKANHDPSMRLECAMEICLCPEGRAFFTKRGDPRRSPWAPSADRSPVPGRDGGEYVIENVRLAHFRCNCSAGARVKRRVGNQCANSGRARHAQHANTPEYHAQQSKAARAGGHVTGTRNLTQQDRSDGGHIGGRKVGLIVSARRVTCACGMTTNPANMARHVRATGHVR